MDSEETAEDSGAETALLPKSFFGDKSLEPGSTCKIKVVRIYDEEVEVEYVAHDKDDKNKQEYDSPEAQLDRMAMPGDMERM